MKDDVLHDNISQDKQTEIKQVVEDIVKAAPVEMVILFGSYARGEHVEQNIFEKGGITHEFRSDYDFLVIVKNQKIKKNNSLWYNLEHQITEQYETPITLAVDTIDFVNRQLKEGNQFYINVKRDGVLLYDSKHYQLSQESQLSPKKQLKVDQGRYEYWMKKAEDHRKNYTFNRKENIPNLAAFHLHQTGESLLNAFLLTFHAYEPHTHSFKILVNMAARVNRNFGNIFPRSTKEDRERFKLLVRAYVDARYDPNYKITETELKYLAEKIKKLKTLVKKACEEKLKL